MKLYLLKCYPRSPLQAEILKLWGQWSYSFVYSQDMYSMHRRMRDLFVIAGNFYFTQEVQYAIEEICSPTERTGWCKNRFGPFANLMNELKLTNFKPNSSVVGIRPWSSFSYDTPDIGAPFWKKNPFGYYAASIYDQVDLYNRFLISNQGIHLSNSEKSINPYYSENLCTYFKVSKL